MLDSDQCHTLVDLSLLDTSYPKVREVCELYCILLSESCSLHCYRYKGKIGDNIKSVGGRGGDFVKYDHVKLMIGPYGFFSLWMT